MDVWMGRWIMTGSIDGWVGGCEWISGWVCGWVMDDRGR